MKLNLDKLSNQLLLVIILVIIIIIPPLIKNIFIGAWFDYTDSGEIGDTIGGITAPFINGLAALLVFITFKEQVKANKLIQEQQYFQHIQEQINRLEDDFLNISKSTKQLRDEIYHSIRGRESMVGEYPPYTFSIDEKLLNKIMYSTAIFKQTLLMVNKIENGNEFLENKLKVLFKIIYKKNYSELIIILNGALEHNCEQNPYIREIATEMKFLNDRFNN